MKQWYCHIAGQQYGPLDQSVLEAWAQQGRLGADHLVWSDGMAEWLPAGQALPMLFQAGPPPLNALVTVPPPGGTGGSTPNAQLMAQAREILTGNWGKAILFYILFCLLIVGIQLIPFIGGIVGLILVGAFQLGLVVFYLSLARRGSVEYGMMFRGFRSFGNALGASLLIGAFVFLWSLLLIVPGIIARIAYSQTFYLLADDKTLGPLEAIRKSKQLMNGYKWKFFCLVLRFLGWSILCVLTLGIGFIFLWPYMCVSYARFYDDLAAARASLIAAEHVAAPDAPVQSTPQA